jgi:hypothetical protein
VFASLLLRLPSTKRGGSGHFGCSGHRGM